MKTSLRSAKLKLPTGDAVANYGWSCLLCCYSITDEEGVSNSFHIGGGSGTSNALNRHISHWFILRRLLDVPISWCESIMEKTEVDTMEEASSWEDGPGSWFRVCDNCLNTVVAEAWKVHTQISELEKKMTEIKNGIRRNMKETYDQLNHRSKQEANERVVKEIRRMVVLSEGVDAVPTDCCPENQNGVPVDSDVLNMNRSEKHYRRGNGNEKNVKVGSNNDVNREILEDNNEGESVEEQVDDDDPRDESWLPTENEDETEEGRNDELSKETTKRIRYKKYPCPLCKMVFREWDKFLYHLGVKHPSEKDEIRLCFLKCDKCEFLGSYPKQLVSHLKHDHGILKSTFSEYFHTTTKFLRQNGEMLVSRDDPTKDCNQDNVEVKIEIPDDAYNENEDDNSTSEISKPNELEKEEVGWDCSKSGRRPSTKNIRKRVRYKKYPCPLCTRVFKDWPKVLVHLKAKHSSATEEVKDHFLNCTKCEFRGKFPNQVVIHQRQVHGIFKTTFPEYFQTTAEFRHRYDYLEFVNAKAKSKKAPGRTKSKESLRKLNKSSVNENPDRDQSSVDVKVEIPDDYPNENGNDNDNTFDETCEPSELEPKEIGLNCKKSGPPRKSPKNVGKRVRYKKYPCPLCTRIFEDWPKILVHVRAKHSSAMGEVKDHFLKCSKCEFRGKFPNQVVIHQRQAHDIFKTTFAEYFQKVSEFPCHRNDIGLGNKKAKHQKSSYRTRSIASQEHSDQNRFEVKVDIPDDSHPENDKNNIDSSNEISMPSDLESKQNSTKRRPVSEKDRKRRIKNYKCGDCEKAFKNWDDFLCHSSVEHPLEEEELKLRYLKCDKCEFLGKVPRQLVLHLQHQHNIWKATFSEYFNKSDDHEHGNTTPEYPEVEKTTLSMSVSGVQEGCDRDIVKENISSTGEVCVTSEVENGQARIDCDKNNTDLDSSQITGGNALNKKYACPLCTSIFRDWSKIQVHIKAKHRSSMEEVKDHFLKCKLCGFRGELPSQLVIHQRQTHAIFKATFAEYFGTSESISSSNANSAVTVTQRREIDAKCIYRCPLCLAKFQNWKKMRFHIKTNHCSVPKEKICFYMSFFLKCDKCDFRGTVPRQLIIHQKQQHGHYEPPVVNGEKILYDNDDEKLKFPPMKSDRSKPRFVCDSCGAGFYYQKKLEYHQIVHTKHFKREWVCDLCGVDYPRKTQLETHKRDYHSSSSGKAEKMYKCRYCDVTSPFNAIIRKHLQSHKQGGAHQCPKCGKFYMNQQGLKRHLRINHNETGKAVKCLYCERKFPSREYMMVHLKRYCKFSKQNKV